jgi:hypothetical protein
MILRKKSSIFLIFNYTYSLFTFTFSSYFRYLTYTLSLRAWIREEESRDAILNSSECTIFKDDFVFQFVR